MTVGLPISAPLQPLENDNFDNDLKKKCMEDISHTNNNGGPREIMPAISGGNSTRSQEAETEQSR